MTHKLVPIEPTRIQIEEGCLAALDEDRSLKYVDETAMKKAYQAMLSAAPSGWMPIESAPRDGSYIIIYVPYGRRLKVQSAKWNKPAQVWQIMNSSTLRNDEPTHWMPLPPAPEVV